MAESSDTGVVLGTNEYKVIIIGAVGVGKTSLLVRYVYNTFEDSSMKVISEEKKKISISGQEVVLDLWDTAGQERYRSITQRFYHSTCAVIIVFDVTDGESYEDATGSWLKEATMYLNLDRPGAPDIPVVVVGNKTDEADARVISSKELKQLKKSKPSLLVAECSAKKGDKVNQLFEMVAREILKRGVNPHLASQSKSMDGSSTRVRRVGSTNNGCC